MFFIELTKFLQNALKREKHEAEEIKYKFVNENVSEKATVLTGNRGGDLRICIYDKTLMESGVHNLSLR